MCLGLATAYVTRSTADYRRKGRSPEAATRGDGGADCQGLLLSAWSDNRSQYTGRHRIVLSSRVNGEL
jgi:hypothetical protein